MDPIICKEALSYEQVILFIAGAILLFSSLYFAFKNYRIVFTTMTFTFFVFLIIASINPESLMNFTIETKNGSKFDFSRHIATQKEISELLKYEKRSQDFNNDDSNNSKESIMNNIALYREAIDRGVKQRSDLDFLIISTKEWKDKNYGEALRQAYYGLLISENKKIKSLLEMRIGTIYRSFKKYEIAKEQFKTSIALDENNIYAYNFLGLTYKKLGDTEKAVEKYLEAIEIDDSYFYPPYNLAILYTKEKEYYKAIEKFLAAIAIDDKQKKTYNQLGNLYLYTGNYLDSEKNYFKAIELDPNYKVVYKNLNKLYNKQNLSKEEKALKIEKIKKLVEPLNISKYFK